MVVTLALLAAICYLDIMEYFVFWWICGIIEGKPERGILVAFSYGSLFSHP
jgi:hypothetical protein